MKMIGDFEKWGDRHHPKLLDMLRIFLGGFLLLKGYLFFQNMPFLRDLILEAKTVELSPDAITAILYYVTYAHMVGGVLIFLGLATRLAAFVQLPIVFGALFFINIFKSPVNSELWLSVVVLILLLLFVVIGSGPISLNNFLTEDEKKMPLDDILNKNKNRQINS
ncbi:DoxX family protein [Mucilaginibacter sp.]|uniref:DoxX family protein n=1 Tax=Mucilaginibacter sp. TaxID=1882438 RepID=UPI0035BC1CBE